MSIPARASSSSPAALAAAAPAPHLAESAAPEPAWITHAVELGYHWARVAWLRAAKIPGAWFDHAKADAVVALWPATFKLTFGRFAGKPFHLRFWQQVVVRLLVGWKVPIEVIDEGASCDPSPGDGSAGDTITIHVRLFRELRLWIARKNGKSEFLAALALLFWALEREVRAEGFCFAHDENQARIVFDKMADMVGYAPALARDIQTFKKSLWSQSRRSPFKLLSGKAAGKHGRAPKVTVGDEMHEWKSRALADTLRQGEGGSLQPIRLYASTAGLKSQAVGHELYEESLQILDGRIDDATTLVVIFAVPEEADWSDEANWPLANPSLGLSPTLAFLRGEHAKAKGNPRAEAEFRCYHLNQFIESIVRWLPAKKWNACKSTVHDWKSLPEKLKGRPCVLAFDSTKSFDLAALCLRFAPELGVAEKAELATIDNRIAALLKDNQGVPFELLERRRALDTPVFIWKHWLPAETIAERTRTENVRFDLWRDAGALTEIPGATFELDWAIAATRQACADYRVEKIGYDGWNALEYYNQLVHPREGSGARPLAEDLLEEMRFGTHSLGEATRKFEKRVFAGDLDHGDNPVVNWMARHCHIRFDDNMNFVPAKRKSVQSIDGVVAAVMAEALALAPAEGDFIGSGAMAVI